MSTTSNNFGNFNSNNNKIINDNQFNNTSLGNSKLNID